MRRYSKEWSFRRQAELEREVERLRAALERIAEGEHNKLCGLPDIARTALAQEEE